MNKEDIIAELEELGFEDIDIKPTLIDEPFVYRVLERSNDKCVIAFYMGDNATKVWKFGVSVRENKLKVYINNNWMCVDPMPIADLMVLYK